MDNPGDADPGQFSRVHPYRLRPKGSKVYFVAATRRGKRNAMSGQGLLEWFRVHGSALPAIAAVIGASVGLAVFVVTQLTGRDLYIATGAATGAVTALILRYYSRSTRLTQLRITVPQFSELTFVVNNEAKQVAWNIYVETVTRISTQPLADKDGLLREALTSLYGLFGTTREALKSSRPSVPVPGNQTVEYLAVTMLNNELRPFLSKWHSRLREFEQAHPNLPESQWLDATACREDLRKVQEHMVEYALNFARLAGVRDAEGMLRGVAR